METKKCTKCLLELDITMFIKNIYYKDGFNNRCKLCVKEYTLLNKEKKSEYDKKYHINNSEKKKINSKEWYQNNKEKSKEYKKKYNITNSDSNKIKKRKYDEENKEKKRIYFINRKATDPLYKLSCYYRTMLNNSFKNKGYIKNQKCIDILGCNFNEFKLHIEALWEPWMTWENKGNPKDGIYELNKTWDIDHIIPTSTAKTEEDVKKLNHYSNLQPLCSYTNRFIKKDN